MFAQPHLFSKSWLARLHRHRLPKFLTSATRVAAAAVAEAVHATVVVAAAADTVATVMVVAAVRVEVVATSVATARVVGLIAHPTPSVALVVKTQKAKYLLKFALH
jgi:sugar (pentulose or hexulose) kinase